MDAELSLVIGKEGAPSTCSFVVHFEHVGSEPFRASSLVVTQNTHERFQMRVEVTLQAPVVNTGPRTITARVTLLTLLLCFTAMRLSIATVVVVLLWLRRRLCFGFTDRWNICTSSQAHRGKSSRDIEVMVVVVDLMNRRCHYCLVVVLVVLLTMRVIGPGCRRVVVFMIVRHTTGVFRRLASYTVEIVWIIAVHA